ncbi:hypothetical protein Golax_009448 [Gossypium laxum]|uniref:Uncharacterized protein n=1 Tax=Gossypium laxum TaxID=34288 RepID=A0A7J9AEL6_9ROSI|nr:hypothetical protein [Gossypium laxum]
MEFGNGRRLEDPLDLDNPIVNDKYDDEYLHAVSGGPWTIFGQYLTIAWAVGGHVHKKPSKVHCKSDWTGCEDRLCGRFEHSSDACLHRSEKKTIEVVTFENLNKDTTAQGGAADWSSYKDAMTHSSDKGDQFGPWMLVERKPHWTPLTATKPIVNSIDVGGLRIKI